MPMPMPIRTCLFPCRGAVRREAGEPVHRGARGPQTAQPMGGGHRQMRIGVGIGIGIGKKESIAIQPKRGLIARAI